MTTFINGTLRVLVSHNPPLSYINLEQPLNSSQRYYGLLLDLLLLVFNEANIAVSKLELYETTYRASPGSMYPNGTWSPGTIRELLSGRANFSLAPHTMTAARLPYIDIVPVSDSGFGMLVRREVSKPGATIFVEPFSLQLWILLLATVFIAAIVFSIIDMITSTQAYVPPQPQTTRVRRRSSLFNLGLYGDRTSSVTFNERAMPPAPERASSMATDMGLDEAGPNAQQLNSAPTSPNQQRSAAVEQGVHHVAEAWLSIPSSEIVPRRRSYAVQLVYLAWGLFCLAAVSAYTGQLTSFLVVNKASMELNSFAELAARKLPFCTIMTSAIQQYFLTSADTLALSMAPYMLVGKDEDECVKMLDNRTVKAFLQHYILENDHATHSPCNMASVDIGFKPSNLGLVLPKNSSLYDPFSQAMLTLRENGVLQSLIQRWSQTLSQCGNDVEESSLELSLMQVYGIFFLVVAGIVISLTWAAAEVAFHCFSETVVGDKLRQTLSRHSLSRQSVSLLVRRRSSLVQPDSPGQVAMAALDSSDGKPVRRVSMLVDDPSVSKGIV